jgi:transcriptional regulator with XRE-family HTH domain
MGRKEKRSRSPDDIGSQMRRARLQKGLTLTALALQLHYSKEHLSRVETGAVQPSEELVAAYIQVLGPLVAESPTSPAAAAPPHEENVVNSPTKASKRQYLVLQQADMQAWLTTFKELRESGQLKLIPGERRAMYLSWQDWDPPFTPQVPELHDFLCKALLQIDHYQEALAEAHATVVASGGTLLSLQQLCLLQFENHDLVGAEETLTRIMANKEMDTVPRVAALEGRLYREKWLQSGKRSDLERSQAAYQRGFTLYPDLYYLGINAVELLVALGRGDEARLGFKQLVELCNLQLRMNEDTSFWIHFTLGEALLGAEGPAALDQAKAEYVTGLRSKPGPITREWHSALEGLRRLVQFAGYDQQVYDDIEALRPL